MSLQDENLTEILIGAAIEVHRQSLVLKIEADLGGNRHVAEAKFMDEAPPIGAPRGVRPRGEAR